MASSGLIPGTRPSTPVPDLHTLRDKEVRKLHGKALQDQVSRLDRFEDLQTKDDCTFRAEDIRRLLQLNKALTDVQKTRLRKRLLDIEDRLEAIQDHEEKLHEMHPQVAASRQLLREKNHDSRYPHLKPRTPWELERDERDPTSQAYLRGESSFMNASAPLDPLPPQHEVEEPQQSRSSSRHRGFDFFRKKKGGAEANSLAKGAGEGSYRRAKRYFGEEYL